MAKFFWIDSDVLIQAKNSWYAFDIAPSFWKALESSIANDRLRSPLAVWTELKKGGDDLFKWADSLKDKFFVAPEKPVQTTLTSIGKYVTDNYVEPHCGDFLSGADPWLIAHAKADHGIVITHEGLKQPDDKKGKVKIPNVCQEFDVECQKLDFMLRQLKVKL